MDEPTTFEQLIAPDEMTLRFTSLGFATGGTIMSPEGKLDHLRNTIASAELVPDVPEEVRQHFARFRKLFLYGVVEYDFFTLVEELVHLELEAAFRHRFTSYYEGRIPIFVEDKVEATLLASSFDDVRTATKLKYRLNHDQRRVRFPTSLTAFFRWARTHRLLIGQRSQLLYAGLAESRNRAAHPTEYSVNIPVAVGQTIVDVAEIINKLWAADTPGGRLFPGLVARIPRAVAVSPAGSSSVEFPSLPSVREDDPRYADWTYTLFLAAQDEELITVGGGGPRPIHQPGFQTTSYPCALLWGPGPREELIGELHRFENDTASDEVEHLASIHRFRG